MNKEQAQTLIALADRARRAGLIDFAEMPATLSALEAAREILNATEAEPAKKETK